MQCPVQFPEPPRTVSINYSNLKLMKMKFYLIVLSLLAVCLWGTGDVRAQSASRSMTVTGKVVDQNGAAVTGASVVVVGTTKGTTTGADRSGFGRPPCRQFHRL